MRLTHMKGTEKTTLVILMLLLCLNLGFAQVNFYDEETWAEAIEEAIFEDKPIFIYLNSSWIPSTKTMDEKVLTDPSVIKLLNEEFVNVKLNGDWKSNKKRLEEKDIDQVSGYIFLNPEAQLITIEQDFFINKKKFLRYSSNVLNFLDSDLYNKMFIENLDKFSLEEIDSIVGKYQNYNFKIKPILKKDLYRSLEQNQSISKDATLFLIDQFEVGDHYELLMNSIPDSLFILNYMEYPVKFNTIFLDLFQDAIASNNMEYFENVCQNFLTTNTILKEAGTIGLDQEPIKKIEKERLKFFKENNRLQDYINLSDTLLNKYLFAHSPEKVNQRDEWNRKFSPKTNMNSRVITPIDSLRSQHLTAMQFSYRLNEICKEIVIKPYPNKDKETGLRWIEKSIEYIDVPSSRIIKAALLRDLKLLEESEVELKKAIDSIYFDHSCQELINELGL